MKLAFRLYDIDRNGSIDASEMTEIIRVSSLQGLLRNARGVRDHVTLRETCHVVSQPRYRLALPAYSVQYTPLFINFSKKEETSISYQIFSL